MTWKVCNDMAKNSFCTRHRSYSPDLAPYDFYLLSQLKMVMRGQCYDDVDAIKQKPTTSSDTSHVKKFKQCMQAWVQYFYHCISNSGRLFEWGKLA